MKELEYQKRELCRFLTDRTDPFYETIESFENWLFRMDVDGITEQIEWIENGTYGAGACLALQRSYLWASLSKRRNTEAACGRVILQATYGAPLAFNRLSPEAQDILSVAVKRWIEQERDWSITLDPSLTP